MADLPTAVTALDPHADTLAGLPFAATELRLASQLSLRLDPGTPAAGRVAAALGVALPVVPCTSATRDGLGLLWLGPDEWLVLAAPGRQAELTAIVASAAGDDFVAVTDVSAQRVALRLSGALVPELLARGCAIDLHPSSSPVGTCVQTLLAQTGITIVVEQDRGRQVLVLLRTSFADYFVAWLAQVGGELAA